MKYRVMGSNRDTGARMILEFEAESKAAAERKATQSGMSVNHVQDVSDGYAGTASEPRTSSRRGGSGFPLGKAVVLLAAAIAIIYFWTEIRQFVGRFF
jgi:hypothetical protein